MEEKVKVTYASKVNVLLTGGGKTVTAVHRLLKEALNKKKKIIWIAHRIYKKHLHLSRNL